MAKFLICKYCIRLELLSAQLIHFPLQCLHLCSLLRVHPSPISLQPITTSAFHWLFSVLGPLLLSSIRKPFSFVQPIVCSLPHSSFPNSCLLYIVYLLAHSTHHIFKRTHCSQSHSPFCILQRLLGCMSREALLFCPVPH